MVCLVTSRLGSVEWHGSKKCYFGVTQATTAHTVVSVRRLPRNYSELPLNVTDFVKACLLLETKPLHLPN